MNKRQFEKVFCKVTAKMATKILYPELAINSTRPERKVVRNNKVLVKHLLNETLEGSGEDGIRPNR